MKKGLLLVILIISCTSCASIFTGKRSNVQIHTNKAVDLIVYGDTIRRTDNKPIHLTVENSKQPLPVVVLDSTRQEYLAVASHKPLTYWMNALPFFYFTGFLVDEITGLKWKYPRRIYIEADSSDISFLPYLPMDPSLLERKNKITFAPLSLVHGYHPAWEFGYERLHGSKSATHLSLGVFRSWDNEFARNSKGVKASLEHKLFLRNQHRLRPYASLTLEYHHKNHDADLRYEVVDSEGNTVFPQRTFNRLTTIEKRFIALTPRIGFQAYLTPRLVAEGFFGVGLRARNVRHQASSPFARHIHDFDWIFFDTDYESNRAIRNISTNWDLNFRIGWVF